MTDEPAPDSGATKPWFERLGTSGKLLAIGGAVGAVASFLPLASISINMGGGAMPVPEGGNLPGFGVPGMAMHQTALVVSNWRGSLCLLGYVAAFILAFLLYPEGELRQKSLAGVAAGGGVLVALLSLWLFVSVLTSGNADMMGMGSVRVSPGIGVLLNLVTGVAVAAGGLLKAREEKVV